MEVPPYYLHSSLQHHPDRPFESQIVVENRHSSPEASVEERHSSVEAFPEASVEEHHSLAVALAVDRHSWLVALAQVAELNQQCLPVKPARPRSALLPAFAVDTVYAYQPCAEPRKSTGIEVIARWVVPLPASMLHQEDP